MRLLLAIGALLSAYGAQAVERKAITDIDVDALTVETQAVASTSDSLELIWWIIPEFWEATFRQNAQMPDQQVDQLLSVIGRYSILGVVQADISPFGAFRFMEKDAVMDALTIEAVDAGGKVVTISHTEPSDPDLRLLLDQMRPVLAQAIGGMGENLYFFPVPIFDDDGERVLSPYDGGQLRVTLQKGETNSTLEIETPLDALFVPRICPNGKPAHVSWTYCPWSGKKLPR